MGHCSAVWGGEGEEKARVFEEDTSWAAVKQKLPGERIAQAEKGVREKLLGIA